MKPDLSNHVRHLNVDSRLWGWYRRDYPALHSDWDNQPLSVIEQYQRAAGGRQVTSAKWSWPGIIWTCMVGIGLLAVVSYDPRAGSATEVTLGIALTIANLYLARNPLGKLPGGVIGSLVAFSLMTAIGPGPFFVYSVPLAAIQIIVLINERRRAATVARTPAATPTFPLPGMVFGDPGGISMAAYRYGAARVAAGAKGEESTALLLKLLLEIPGTTIFHGLRFPGSRDADVDHAIVHGNMVILIDSKQFRDGIYSWARGRNAIANSVNRRHYENHMDAARDGYFRILGGEAHVHAVVMIHGEAVVVDAGPEFNGVLLATAHDAMDHVGTLVAADFDLGGAGFDNRRIVGRLLQNLK